VLLWDILCVLVDISTRTPYCTTVCLCLNNSLTHSLTTGNIHTFTANVYNSTPKTTVSQPKRDAAKDRREGPSK
jgi:hypothetical protein